MENIISKGERQMAASANAEESEKFKHPPIVMDLLYAFKQWYGIHQHLPKLYRITISTKMMEALSECIEKAVLVNFGKQSGKELEIGREKLLELRGRIELIKAYALISWEMKFIGHGFFAQYTERLEKISKQAAAWHGWFVKKYSPC